MHFLKSSDIRIKSEHFQKPVNYRLALLSEFLSPVLRVFARLLVPSAASPYTWRKGLLIGSDHIGDILYRSSSLPELAKAFPNCQWHIVAPPPADQLLENNPNIAGVIRKFPRGFGAFSTLIRSHCFDVIICYGSPLLWKDLSLGVLAGIPNRVAYSFKGFSGLINHPVKINFPQPFPAYFRDIVAQLAFTKSDWSLRPLIYPNMSDEAEAENIWCRHGLGKSGSVFACFMTTRQPTGLWPSENFGHALSIIKKQTGACIALCGMAEDRALLEHVDKSFNLKCVILAGELRLRALYCFLKKTKVVLTSDSGPRHIANAAGVPVFFIRNVWFNRIEAGPYVDTETDLAPLDQHVPPERQSDIFAKIRPEAVAEKLIKVLK